MSEWSPRANEIFLAAIDIASPGDRARLVDEACGQDAALRAVVQRLLDASERAARSRFLESPPHSVGATGTAAPSPDDSGAVIGNYRLVERIGEGGFGVVYAAEQTQPIRRQVAIKIVKPGMDSRRIIARFETERQALAVMDHPGIARVLDAGTTDAGRPYFVMEMVRGLPITRYCDQERLTPRQRLELFVPVCEAVQHAHQKGVIHRDLKPSNILVALYDGRPVPKVIDFGVARAMSLRPVDQEAVTEIGGIIGTLEYMAPEQAEPNSVDIDTRADVYSLGVLLYELLTGSPPFTSDQLRSAAFDQVLRMIREVEPAKPSTRLSTAAELPAIAARRQVEPDRLHQLVSGDLDWIVMKALEKDRARRYATANGLAMDLLRHLADEPVTAAAPSRAYRLRKFVRRHKAGVVALGTMLVLLLGGIAGTTWGLIRADAARREAATRAEGERAAKETVQQREVETQAVLNFVESRILATARPQGQEGGLGRDVTLRAAIEAAIPAIESSFANQPLIEARLRATLGRSFLFLGDRRSAVTQWQRARSIYLAHRGADHPDTLKVSGDLANGYDMLGRHDDAIALQSDTLARRKAAFGADDPSTLLAMMNLANAYLNLGQFSRALELQEQTVALQRSKLGPDHLDTLKTTNNLSITLARLGRHADALPLREHTLAVRRAKLGPDHPETIGSMQNLAKVYYDLGRYADALALHEQTLEVARRVLGPRHPDTIRTIHTISADYLAMERYDDAIRTGEEAFSLRRDILGPTHPDTLGSMNNLGNAYEAAGRAADAMRLREETLALRRAALGRDHPETLTSMSNLALSYAAAGRHAEALALRQETRALRRQQLGADHPDAVLRLGQVAESLVRLNRPEEALPLIDDCLARLTDRRPADPALHAWLTELRRAAAEK
jgi:serine/threonine protein kinase/tetratricopeptide (TPR) repeat protein